MQVEEVCFPLVPRQQTTFQDCNGVRSGVLAALGCLGSWDHPSWGVPIPFPGLPSHPGKGNGTLRAHGSPGWEVEELYSPEGIFAPPALIPSHKQPVLRDDLLELCLCISPSDREAFTCFKAPQLLPPELPVLFFWAALLCASPQKNLFQMVEITANHLSLEQRCCCFIEHQTLGIFVCVCVCASHKYSVGIMTG